MKQPQISTLYSNNEEQKNLQLLNAWEALERKEQKRLFACSLFICSIASLLMVDIDLIIIAQKAIDRRDILLFVLRS